MFKLKGEVEIIKTNFFTGEVTAVITQENLIPDNTLLELLNWEVPSNYFGSKRISISSQTDAPNYNNATVNNIIATGYIPNNITSPIWIETVEPPYGIIKNRIDFIGLARTFYTVALTNLNPNNDSPDETATAGAYLLLTLPCTQGEFEYLDIQYRIQFIAGFGQGFLDEKTARYDFGRAVFGLGNFKISYLYANLCKVPTSVYDGFYLGGELSNFGELGSYIARFNPVFVDSAIGWNSGTVVADHFKFKYSLSFNRDTQVGRIFNAMLQGFDNLGFKAYSIATFKYNEEPFQTGFWHSSGAVSPFFDASFTGSSNGKIYLSGTWIGGFPELYKINIASSGATNVASYSFSLRKHLGFVDNTYVDRDVATPFRNPHLASASKQHGWREENNDVLRWSNTQVVQYDDTGVTLIDVLNGNYTNWEVATTPSLPATQIRQVAVDLVNQKIYVGCRTTGLWVIDVAINTITNQLSAPCYGVDVGRNNVAIALVDGGLYSSANWGSPVTFTYMGITDSNWNKTWFLRADPENINDQIAIIFDNAGTNQVCWYQFSDLSAAAGYAGGEIKKYPASLNVSDTGSFWAIQYGRLIWGDNFITGLSYSISAKTLEHSIFGNDNYYQVSFYNDGLITLDTLLDINNIPINSYLGLQHLFNSPYSLHLDSGIILCSKFMRQLFTDNVYCWQNYGWDGTNWVKDNPGSKTTHTTPDAIINGLTIRFQDGDSLPQFVATDFFTKGVNWGLLKDNATSIDSYVSQWYTRDVVFNALFSGTIPSAEPYTLTLDAASLPEFLRLETDTPQLHEFKIMSILVVAVYVNGEPPGPNEVAINSNGIVTFNSVDAGKTFNAKYTYIKI
jgi:hypothetical protein